MGSGKDWVLDENAGGIRCKGGIVEGKMRAQMGGKRRANIGNRHVRR